MIACVPTANADVAKVAAPVASRPSVASRVVPSLKRTTPVGMPPVELTRAVSDIDCPATTWVVSAVSAVVVAMGAD